MIPLLYKKDGTSKIGELTNCIECLVEEERNGLFEASIVYPTTDSIFNSLEEENVIICDANDTLKAQKFRIYMTRKLMSNKIEVYARHISFDLAYDTVDNIDITNQSCEYALNTIFRQSQFSTHYKGYSDIVNAQNYKMSMANCIEAIAGKEGSIIDTFGTGAEILRDNTNIHVLNKRGHDNEVSIEYAKNLTGFELEEDYSELVTRINAYAKYTNSETNEEVLVEAKSIDSTLIANYSHPYVAYIDYSDKFENEEIPTKEKLIELAKKEYSINNKDKPKQNYKIEFVPLSKCVGYEDLEDKISLCDTVVIKDTRYGIDTKSKVIRTVFDVLKNRYDSMELGEPKTTLGDIIGGSGEDGVVGPPGPQGPPGADGNIGDFPDSLPSTPILSYKLYGFANIELSWTFENKVYYQYELYASKTKDFTPNVFDIIHQGQTSSFLFQAKPNETWYFRVCCVNSHGNRTEFSSQIAVTTKKVDDLSNYVDNMAINDALIGTLNLDRGWVGKLNANYLDVKGNLSVTDGNGKRTLDIDSFGNISMMPTNFKLLVDGKEENIATQSQVEQTSKDITYKFEQGGAENIVLNSNWEGGMSSWNYHYTPTVRFENGHLNPAYGKMIRIQGDYNHGLWQKIKTIPGEIYTVSFYAESHELIPTTTKIGIEEHHMVDIHGTPAFQRHVFTFTATLSEHTLVVYSGQDNADFYVGRVMVTEGDVIQGYRKNSNEIHSNSVKFDINGMEIDSENANTKNRIDHDGFAIIDKTTLDYLLKATSESIIARGGKFVVEDTENGNTVLWGRDIVINGQRALVGTGANAQDGLISNKLYLNYLNDFISGVEIGGTLTNDGRNVLSLVNQNSYKEGYMKLSNGFLLQWGHVTGIGISSGVVDTTITYPIQFPSKCLVFIAVVDAVDNDNYLATQFSCISRVTGSAGGWFYARNLLDTRGGSMNINYIAIGY